MNMMVIIIEMATFAGLFSGIVFALIPASFVGLIVMMFGR